MYAGWGLKGGGIGRLYWNRRLTSSREIFSAKRSILEAQRGSGQKALQLKIRLG